MATKSQSDLKSALDTIEKNLEKLMVLQDDLIAREEMWRARAAAAEAVLEWIEPLSVSANVIAAAEADGKPPDVWIAEKIAEACDPKPVLPVDREIYDRFVELAKGRGLSLQDLCTSVDVTGLLRDLFLNMYI